MRCNPAYLSRLSHVCKSTSTLIRARWEVTYHCSKLVNPFTDGVIHTFCDSATAYDPVHDLTTVPPDQDGYFSVMMNFRNNVCIYHSNFACPAITARVRLRPNPNSPNGSGYDISFIRDGMPAMGAYAFDQGAQSYKTIYEDSQKVHNGSTAILALAGLVEQSSYTTPPPPEQPDGCYRE